MSAFHFAGVVGFSACNPSASHSSAPRASSSARSSGNIHRSYGNKTTEVVRGALTRLPWSGGLFLAGFIAITGSPPFAPFISEYTIVSSAFVDGRYLVAGLLLLFLTIVFIGMALTVLPMVMGAPPEEATPSGYRDSLLMVCPPLVTMAIILVLGVWPPAPLLTLLKNGAALLGVPS